MAGAGPGLVTRANSRRACGGAHGHATPTRDPPRPAPARSRSLRCAGGTTRTNDLLFYTFRLHKRTRHAHCAAAQTSDGPSVVRAAGQGHTRTYTTPHTASDAARDARRHNTTVTRRASELVTQPLLLVLLLLLLLLLRHLHRLMLLRCCSAAAVANIARVSDRMGRKRGRSPCARAACGGLWPDRWGRWRWRLQHHRRATPSSLPRRAQPNIKGKVRGLRRVLHAQPSCGQGKAGGGRLPRKSGASGTSTCAGIRKATKPATRATQAMQCCDGLRAVVRIRLGNVRWSRPRGYGRTGRLDIVAHGHGNGSGA